MSRTDSLLFVFQSHLFSLMIKLIERIVSMQIVRHLQANNLMDIFQPADTESK